MKRFSTLLLPLTSILALCCGCSNDKSLITNANNTNEEYLKVAALGDPLSLDPRLVRDLHTVTVIRMLYEGLMTENNQGEIIPAVAKSVAISDDKKTYTFTLRDALWSDGTPITANDFEETWKSVLLPETPAPNAYQLYVIKGAQAAKEGKAPPDTIGVKATDLKTLVVELETPTPYFLEMTACHFFFPVSPSMRKAASGIQTDKTIGNGPFIQSEWKRRSEFTAIRNLNYWNAKDVKLAGVSLQVLDENTALQLYKSGAIDWAGSPLSTLPQDAIITLKEKGLLKVSPGAGTHWFRVNTQLPPLDDEKVRRAFALALDRKAIVEHVTQGNQQPAFGIVPPSFGFTNQTYFADHDTDDAKKLFQEALSEKNKTKADLPSITLRYAASDRNHKIAQAVQQQWGKAFGINIILESSESQVLLDKMRSGDYQISMGSWYADIRDPINFLEIFKSKDNPTNQTFWENNAYTALLNQSSLELDQAKRFQILQKAEKLLIGSMPVIPLFYSAYNFLTTDRVAGVYFSPLGHLDFKDAYLNPSQQGSR